MKFRRFYALFFSLVMLLSLSLPALAAEGAEPEPGTESGGESGAEPEPQDEEFRVEAKAALLIDPDREEIL